MQKLKYHFLFLFSVFCFPSLVFPWSHDYEFSQAKNYEGSSDLIDLRYRMGPVLASDPVKLYIIWYGHWDRNHQSSIKDFIYSLTASSSLSPSVADWWQTVRLYTDQSGSNVTGNIVLSREYYDTNYSHGRYLSRLSMQSIIKTAVSSQSPKSLPLNPYNGLYLVLTSGDVQVQDFCRAVCGFHYLTFPHIVGVTVPYAWVGYSGTQCPGMCAYPFAWPGYSGKPPPNAKTGGNNILKAPNGDPAVDGMISVIAHELAEVSTNPLINAWYAGDDPTNPAEVADLCLGVYGTGAGGGYVGKVYKDNWGIGFNVNGVKGRRFLVQWVWNLEKKRCFGPNAMD